MSNDDEQRALYEMRTKILKDRISALNKAKEEGWEEGREEGIKEGIKEGLYTVARALLDLLEDDMIADKTGLTIEEIKELRANTQ